MTTNRTKEPLGAGSDTVADGQSVTLYDGAKDNELWSKYVNMVESDFPEDQNKLGTNHETIPEEFIQELEKDLWEHSPLPTQWRAWIPAALVLFQIAINLQAQTYAFITNALDPWRSLVFNTTFEGTFEALVKTGSLPPDVQTDLHIFIVTNLEFCIVWIMVTYTVFQFVLLLTDKSGSKNRHKGHQDKKNRHKGHQDKKSGHKSSTNKKSKKHKYETITENEKYFQDPDSKDLDEKHAEDRDKKDTKDPDQNSSNSYYAKRVYIILRQLRAIGSFSLLQLMKVVSFQTLDKVFKASGKVFLPLNAKPVFPTAHGSFVKLQIKTFASLRTLFELRGGYAKKHEKQKSVPVQILLALWGLLLVLLWIITFVLFIVLPLILCIMGLFSKTSQAATPPQPNEPAISPTNFNTTTLRRRDAGPAVGLSLLALLPLPTTLAQNYSTVIHLLGFVNQFMSVVQGVQRSDFFEAHELEDEMVFQEVVGRRGTLGAVVWDMNTGFEDSKREFWEKTKGKPRVQETEVREVMPVGEVMIPMEEEEEEPFVPK